MNPTIDHGHLQAALACAEAAVGLSDPNPRVGCVLVAPDGRLIGRGHTQAAGGPHAEVMALRDAAASGHDARGATAYVSLEPCSHHGRTPPCCDALIAAGIARVVAACEDPNPLVAGRGLQRLAAAGIAVALTQDAAQAAQAAALNVGFFKRMRCGLPHVRLKWASSLDGRTAWPNGHSQWITNATARADGHRWRQRAGALLTGIGTVLADDPQLTVRGVPVHRPPLRVVADSQGRWPRSARMAQGSVAERGPVLVAHTVPLPAAAIQDWPIGVSTWQAPADAQGHVDLQALLAELGRREINEVHVEAGARLNGALLQAGLVDELLIYLAPRLVGPGLGTAELPTPLPLEEHTRWRSLDLCLLDGDVRWRLLRP